MNGPFDLFGHEWLLNNVRIDKLVFKNKNLEPMKIKLNYKLRKIANETIVVNQGIVHVNMTCIISLKVSADQLNEVLAGRELTAEDVTNVLVDTYGIGGEQALNDAKEWIESRQQCEVIEWNRC